MTKKKNIISEVEKGSIAEELEIIPGDILISINGQEILDVFDYRYFLQEENVDLLIEKADGEQWLLEIEKDESEDLGLLFQQGLMDSARHCSNRCIFCFIDQLPEHMRETLYFKDDDSRLSFLQGNYVTLTNMSEKDIERILYYHLSPINISVHAGDPKLRAEMMGNPKAAHLLPLLEKFKSAGIEMNFQIVLCRGVNDRDALDHSMDVLSRLMPAGHSLSVVPVGLTSHRKGLCSLTPWDRASAETVLAQIHRFQQDCLTRHGTRFVYAADEFYLTAGQSFPEIEAYEEFPQLENGVGMLPLFESEFRKALDQHKSVVVKPLKITLATGCLAAPSLQRLLEIAAPLLNPIELEVLPIKNQFFGKNITVSGLLTGRDLKEQLSSQDSSGIVLIPGNALKAGGPNDPGIFLDDMTVPQLSKSLARPVYAGMSGGGDFLNQLLILSRKHGKQTD